MLAVPPSDLVRDLAAYDPLLRLRWASRTSMWFVERKLPERHRQLVAERPNPFHSDRGWDLWDGWRDGYVHVMSVHPELAANVPLVLQALHENDTWARGGFNALNRHLDDLDDARERATDRLRTNFVEAATSDAYDFLKWRQGERAAVRPPSPLPPDEPHDGFVVRDRRWPTVAS